MLAPWKKSYDQSRQPIKKQRHYFANKGPSSQSYSFSSSHVWMWELDYKESWVLKNWCFWTVVLEKTLNSPLECKEIKPVPPKGNQPWIFTGRTDAEAEAPILCPPDVKNWLSGKDPDAGKDWRWEEKGMTEDEMVGWHHWLNWHGFGWTPGVSDGQGGLVCCGSWGCKESGMTERLINNNHILGPENRDCVGGKGQNSLLFFQENLWTWIFYVSLPLFQWSQQGYFLLLSKETWEHP